MDNRKCQRYRRKKKKRNYYESNCKFYFQYKYFNGSIIQRGMKR